MSGYVPNLPPVEVPPANDAEQRLQDISLKCVEIVCQDEPKYAQIWRDRVLKSKAQDHLSTVPQLGLCQDVGRKMLSVFLPWINCLRESKPLNENDLDLIILLGALLRAEYRAINIDPRLDPKKGGDPESFFATRTGALLLLESGLCVQGGARYGSSQFSTTTEEVIEVIDHALRAWHRREQVDHCRLVVHPSKYMCWVSGKSTPLTSDQHRILKVLADAGGGWVGGCDLRVLDNPKERPDRIIKESPSEVAKLIVSRPGRGGGYRIACQIDPYKSGMT